MVRNWLLEEESGQGMVEYALILALISVVAIALMGNIGDAIKTKFGKISSALSKA